MARFYTSDSHFGDNRFDIFYRPFKTVKEQEDYLVEKWNSVVGPDDEVWHLGDFATTDKALNVRKRLNGKIYLILGNYDVPRDRDKLEELFDEIYENKYLTIGDSDRVQTVYMNHYPEKASLHGFNLVGHIHSLWKVHRNMINVSSDAWHFTPVSEKQILMCMNAIDRHYDVNVFAGEIRSNYINIGGKEIYAEEQVPSFGQKVFLAGPTPRSKNVKSWRPEMTEKLRTSGFKGHILIPEKRSGDDYDFIPQVRWEEEALDAADLIIFWIPRNLKTMPGFTTNIEFGEWMKSGKIAVGWPPEAEKNRYIMHKCGKYEIPHFSKMDHMAGHVVRTLDESKMSKGKRYIK